jgi:hypothetical protein
MGKMLIYSSMFLLLILDLISLLLLAGVHGITWAVVAFFAVPAQFLVPFFVGTWVPMLILIAIGFLGFVLDSQTESKGARIVNSPTPEAAMTSIKTCTSCKNIVPIFKNYCAFCSGTMFTHSQLEISKVPQTSEEAMYEIFSQKTPQINDDLPEFKVCPMCAEQINFAAKKCRYCQHLLDAKP